MHRSVLLVDDDTAALLVLDRFFTRQGWRVHQTTSTQEAVSLYETVRPSLTILDLHLPYLSGLELLEIFRERDPDLAIIMLTGHADVESAVTAMRMGAENYLVKPVNLEQLAAVARKAFDTVALRRSNRVLTGQAMTGSPTAAALQQSAAMQRVDDQIDRMAASDAAVLLIGETGTGKSWVAKTIHSRSSRSGAPIIELNCAGLSRENLEQSLFGEERLTTRGKRIEPRGLFELADGGTLLLDQVGMLAPELQPKLLHVLETKHFRRVGGTEEIEVDVRILAAASQNLQEEVRAGRFLEGLYYRLAVLPLRLPPVRDHARADLLGIARELLRSLQRQMGGVQEIRIPAEVADLLAHYAWPGNIREMRNVFERILILNPQLAELGPEHLPPEVQGGERAGPAQGMDPTLPLQEVERLQIISALRHFAGNRSQAAKSLRISRRTLYDKIDKYGLEEGS